MQFHFTWCLLLAPALPALVGMTPTPIADRLPRVMDACARMAAGAALIIAIGGGAALAIFGPLATATAGPRGIGVAVYFDTLTALMLTLVSFISLVVIIYSRNYLDGDPGQGRFFKWLCLTVAAVLTLVLSGNLLQLAAAWIATSVSLHKLLLFYPQRPGARLAARKKFIVSRLGDLCLIAASVLIYRAFGALDFARIFSSVARLRAEGVQPSGATLIAGLLVASAVFKSAQFPFHGWLTEVMETPTPVSALLHAGIINAGGFLIVRLSGLISLATPALDALALIGGFTALFGSAVMLTQSSVKVSLAWSTLAQMGFMLLQCGLGAFSSAVLHIVAHSLYKAHAFLSSGSVVDLSRASGSATATGGPRPMRVLAALALGVFLAFGVGAVFGLSLANAAGVLVLAAVLMMGLAYLLVASIGEQPTVFVIARASGIALAIAFAYFALQWGAAHLLAGAVPIGAMSRGGFDYGVVVLVIATFAEVLLLQSLMPYRGGEAPWRRLHVHLFNGLYVNAFTNRIVARLWPGVTRPAVGGTRP